MRSKLLYEAKPEDYVTTMVCTECGHRYELTPAAVMVDEADRAHRYFGSDYDFCPVCDGYPREAHDE